MAYLEIKNFHKKFDKLEVLRGIDLSIEKGEVISIIGSSGGGKSTLLRAINFLEIPDDGTMTLDGEILFDCASKKDYTEAELRDKRLNFGLVFQSFNLFPQYNVLDNITLAPKLLLKDKIKVLKKQLKSERLSFSERNKRLAEFKKIQTENINAEGLKLLENIGLTDKLKAYPCELSGGQCQRVAIARALALKPKILCFDEPTSALDPELTGEVLKVIRALKDEGRTMIIVTHEMGFAKSVSDKVVFIYQGLVEEEGSPEEVFDNTKSPILKSFLSSITDKDGNC